jgi:multisubunit Na+/H+ antiporter MnhB subunit
VSTVFFVLMIISMLAVLGALGIGLFFMSHEGDENRKKSNQWMRIRVWLQGVAIALFALAAMTAGK